MMTRTTNGRGKVSDRRWVDGGHLAGSSRSQVRARGRGTDGMANGVAPLGARHKASPSPGRPRFIHPRNALFRIRVGTTKKRAARLIAGGRGGSSRLTILVTKSLARAVRSRPQAYVRGMARVRCVPGQDTVPAVLQNRGRARGGFGSWVNDD
jgi:hypothetical protein